MIPILIIIILSCCAILVSIFIQAMLQSMVDDLPFEFTKYRWTQWFGQIIWWVLQACLFIWYMIILYPKL